MGKINSGNVFSGHLFSVSMKGLFSQARKLSQKSSDELAFYNGQIVAKCYAVLNTNVEIRHALSLAENKCQIILALL